MSQEQAYKWKGNIGLISTSDYVKATTNSACINAYNYYTNLGCYSTASTDNWMYTGTNWWAMSPLSYLHSYSVWHPASNGNFHTDHPCYSYDIYPVFYLSSDIVLKGDGSYEKPYTVVENSGGTTGDSGTTSTALSSLITVSGNLDMYYSGTISQAVDVDLSVSYYESTDSTVDTSEDTLLEIVTISAGDTSFSFSCHGLRGSYYYYVVVSDPSGTYSGSVISSVNSNGYMTEVCETSVLPIE